MKTCKYCIHYARCVEIYEASGFFFDYEKSCCKQFSDRSEWVHLPCNVGDTVYHVYPKKGIQTNTVRQIQIGSCGMNIFDFNGFFEPSVFGKTVFLTREEAEKALKGSETE